MPSNNELNAIIRAGASLLTCVVVASMANASSGVFIVAQTVAEEVDVPVGTFVPSFTFMSQDRIDRLRKTNPRECKFMEDIIETNLKLAEGYLGSTQMKGITDG